MTDPFMYDQIDFTHMTEAVTAVMGRDVAVFCPRPTIAPDWYPDPRFLVCDFGRIYKTKEPLSGHNIDKSIAAIITELQQRDEERRLRQEKQFMADDEHDVIVQAIANRLEQYYHTIARNYTGIQDEYRYGQIRGAEDAYKMVLQMKKSFTLENT